VYPIHPPEGSCPDIVGVSANVTPGSPEDREPVDNQRKKGRAPGAAFLNSLLTKTRSPSVRMAYFVISG
jgi:hypothetical protein